MVVATSPGITFRTTRVFEELLRAFEVDRKRYALLEGGTSSSKTFSALQFLIVLAQKSPVPLLISIVSESLPHLKRGAMRDFFTILQEPMDNNAFFNKTEATYSRPGWRGKFEFFGADDAQKVRGPRRHILFINEGNNVPWSTAQGLDARTELLVIVDWNPVGEFWAHEYWLNDPRTMFSHSTYLDAEMAGVLSPAVKENIEAYKDKDPNWWNVYGLGLVGKMEGLVYPHFKQVKEMPEGERFYGLDFGYLVDPTALVENVIVGENLYSREVFYDDSGLTNDAIARKMDLARVDRRAPIYADPNEPKSAEELRNLGWNVCETVKGPGSVAFGQQKVNQFYQHWTEDSLNCIKEQRNFRFIMKSEPRTGREYLSDDTTHKFSHSMSARRYAVASKIIRVGGVRSRTTISERRDGVVPRSFLSRR